MQVKFSNYDVVTREGASVFSGPRAYFWFWPLETLSDWMELSKTHDGQRLEAEGPNESRRETMR